MEEKLTTENYKQLGIGAVRGENTLNNLCVCGKLAKYLCPFPTQHGLVQQKCCEDCMPSSFKNMLKESGASKIEFHH